MLMYRSICVFVGRTCNFVRNALPKLTVTSIIPIDFLSVTKPTK